MRDTERACPGMRVYDSRMPTQSRLTSPQRIAARRGGAALLLVLLSSSVGFGATHRHEGAATVQHCAVCHVAGSAVIPALDVALPADQPLEGPPLISQPSAARPRLSDGTPFPRAPPQHA